MEQRHEPLPEVAVNVTSPALVDGEEPNDTVKKQWTLAEEEHYIHDLFTGDYYLQPDVVRERLPELQYIKDDSLRFKTVCAFSELCPAYFWTAPASTNHHQVDHREVRGLWLHTKRAFTTYQRMVGSPVNQGRMDEFDADCGRAAILLHDMFKQGRGLYGSGTTEDDHDTIAYKALKNSGFNFPRQVLDCVHSHNGPWYDGSDPLFRYEEVHHMADMVASDENSPGIKVADPHDLLLKQFPYLDEERANTEYW